MKQFLFFISAWMICGSLIAAQTISEKKASLASGTSEELDKESQAILNQVNDNLETLYGHLAELYAEAQVLFVQDSPEEYYKCLLNEIQSVKKSIKMIQEQWREKAAVIGDSESYALWHEPGTTLEQLIMEYGSQDYIYLIPPEIGSIKVSLSSNLPIPRASWGEMLEKILAQSGVGIKQLNPYLRQLVLLKKDFSAVQVITSDRNELNIYPRETSIAFLLKPEVTDVRRLYHFMEKFSDPENVALQMVGQDILIVSQVGTVQEILKLYDFVVNNQIQGNRDYRFVALTKIKADEMARILNSIFGEGAPSLQKKPAARFPTPLDIQRPLMSADREDIGLKVVTLTGVTHGLFLLGSPEELRKAEDIISDVQCQLGEAKDKTIFWYTAKHSEPEELAKVLGKVYALMICASCDDEFHKDPVNPIPDDLTRGVPFYAGGNTIVNPAFVTPNVKVDDPKPTEGTNFIVDPKTGSIVMVVETEFLPRLKDLLRRLDVPKKMVHIDVLLFEKKMTDHNKFGLNLLRIGSCASNTDKTCLAWNDLAKGPENKGILDFMLSRMRGCGLPAYDLAYNFLISQDNVQINASPSITTVNQTPATIAIVEEISINTGIVEIDTTASVALKDAFARAQYGITIQITPTIHSAGDNEIQGEDNVNYITLETDITFDTVQPRGNERPDVTRRHINNEVRVADGETIILGGLKRLNTSDAKESIPFIGEIPGIGKLFSTNDMLDTSTEMFIFITPHIIEDNSEALEKIRFDELCRRPGDTPEFLRSLWDGKECSRRRLFEGSLKMLLGRSEDLCR